MKCLICLCTHTHTHTYTHIHTHTYTHIHTFSYIKNLFYLDLRKVNSEDFLAENVDALQDIVDGMNVSRQQEVYMKRQLLTDLLPIGPLVGNEADGWFNRSTPEQVVTWMEGAIHRPQFERFLKDFFDEHERHLAENCHAFWAIL